jgi:hypothetical protein
MATTINYFDRSILLWAQYSTLRTIQAIFWAFVIAGFSYLNILGFVHLLMPKMTPLDDNLNYIH